MRKALHIYTLLSRVLCVAEVRNKQFVITQVAQRACTSAYETCVHAHKLVLKMRFQLLDDLKKQLPIRGGEKVGPLAIERLFVAPLENGEKVLLTPIGTVASVVSIKSVGSPISATSTLQTRRDPCLSGSSSKTARCDSCGTQSHHVTGSDERDLTANHPRSCTPPSDLRSLPSCSTIHSPPVFLL